MANPFESKNKRSAMPADDDDLIETLPALPAEIDTPLPDEQEANAKYGEPVAAANAAPLPNATAPLPNTFIAATQDRSIGALPNDELATIECIRRQPARRRPKRRQQFGRHRPTRRASAGRPAKARAGDSEIRAG